MTKINKRKFRKMAVEGDPDRAGVAKYINTTLRRRKLTLDIVSCGAEGGEFDTYLDGSINLDKDRLRLLIKRLTSQLQTLESRK